MKTTSGASPATRLTNTKQDNEARTCGQILPTAKVIMKNEIDKRSLCQNKTEKERACEGRYAALTDPPNSSGHEEKRDNAKWSLCRNKT